MALAPSVAPSTPPPLRLMPGVVTVALQWFIWLILPRLAPDSPISGLGFVVGSLLGGLVILLWWAFASRASRLERWGGALAFLVAFAGTRRFVHPSVAGAGMGFLFYLYILPILCLALVGWALLRGRLPERARLPTLIAMLFLAAGLGTLVRLDGITGGGTVQFAWRWTPTNEERLLAQLPPTAPPAPAPAAPAEPVAATPMPTPAMPSEPKAPAIAPATPPAAPSPAPAPPPALPVALPVETASAVEAAWPGFRGRHRDGVVTGVTIATDWAASPPLELWRRPVGPAWSSFAVEGDRIYTQEQRGEEEVVACYDGRTGAPIWTHGDPTRFWEANAGAGPRGTPTLEAGRVYTLGGTGLVNVLDAGTGARIWSRNAAADTEVETPYWGFAASPLVYGDLVFIATSGRLAAYDRATGEPRWLGPKGKGSYSSPHLATLGGVPQILLMNGDGIAGFAPADGTRLWQYAWEGVRIVQPGLTPDGDVLIATGGAAGGTGTRRLAIAQGATGWTVDERWTSDGLKPYFNDFVVHDGYAYGFDGRILACIDLATGERRWKGGRYGNGQLVLLAEQGLLLVLSEQGELALVKATPEGFTELARHPGITGKTWNHPVVAGHLLLVRNAEEMAAFELPGDGGRP